MLYFAHAPLTLVASASFSTAMICSSLNRLLFIGSAPHYRAELYFYLVHFFGVRPPAPLTVTVPEDPGWFPTMSAPQSSTPASVTARLPPPASPTVVVPATERLAPEGLPPFTPSIWFEPALKPTVNAGSVSTAVPTMSM